MSPILRIFIALFVIYMIQSVFSVFQIRAYQRALQESRSLGTIGVGQKKARFGIIKGNIVIVGCDKEGVITGGQIMEGVTLFARFKPVTEIIEGRPIQEGETIYDYLEEFRAMPEKEQRYYKGFIQALEAIEMRFAHEQKGYLAMMDLDDEEKAALEGQEGAEAASEEEFDIDAL